jgi:hypothetical protein
LPGVVAVICRLAVRVLLLAAIACVSFELSGLAAACGDAGCAQECDSDDDSGPCPPNCGMCSCCSLPKSAPVALSAELPRPDCQVLAWLGTALAPPACEPTEILHVPRRLPA